MCFINKADVDLVSESHCFAHFLTSTARISFILKHVSSSFVSPHICKHAQVSQKTHQSICFSKNKCLHKDILLHCCIFRARFGEKRRVDPKCGRISKWSVVKLWSVTVVNLWLQPQASNALSPLLSENDGFENTDYPVTTGRLDYWEKK